MNNKISYIERVVPGTTLSATFQEHMNRYIFASNYVKNKSVLDAACGTGYGSDYLSKKGAKYVFGLDVSNDAIHHAKNTYKKRDLVFSLANIQTLPFHNEVFDVIVSFETIEHVASQEITLTELERVLKFDGLLIISSPNRKLTSPGRSRNNPWNPYHVLEYTREEFISVLGKYFKVVGLFGQIPKSKFYFLPGIQKVLRKIFHDLYSFESVDSDVSQVQSCNEYVYIIALCTKLQDVEKEFYET